MSETAVYVVFGAAVRPDGSASPTLARRTLGAWALSESVDDRRFLVTGGQGRFGPAEALVMRDLLLDRGVAADEIEVEDRSRDTLESALRCAKILGERSGREETIVVATSEYHRFRCWLLLRMLGIRAQVGQIPGDRSAAGLRDRLYLRVRELAATPWDVLLLWTVYRGGRRELD